MCTNAHCTPVLSNNWALLAVWFYKWIVFCAPFSDCSVTVFEATIQVVIWSWRNGMLVYLLMRAVEDKVDYFEVLVFKAFRSCSVLGSRIGLLRLFLSEDFDCRDTRIIHISLEYLV